MTRRHHRANAPWSGGRCPMRERVSAYVDNEASVLEQAVVGRHLQGCAACREFVAFSRQAQEIAHRSRLQQSPARVSPATLAAAARPRRRVSDRMHRSVLGIAAALLIGVLTGAIGTEVVIRESATKPTPLLTSRVTISPRNLDPDYQRELEPPPKPAPIVPVIQVIEPLKPDPSWRWAGLETGESYPEGYRLELVRY